MRTKKKSRVCVPRIARVCAGLALPAAVLSLSAPARAQIAGTVQRPLPNVLLLIDTSGSMERMPDNSLPSRNRDPVTGGTIGSAPFNACSPGVESNPNRWGMLIQALTGNLQPYFSCNAIDRTTAGFKNEFKINNVNSYDADYFLPYHRPLSGDAAATACVYAPYTLPGTSTGTGVGPSGRAVAGDPRDFPADAFTSVLNTHLTSQYSGNSSLSLPANACLFDQALDGQLDATRDFIRFGLMTFDNDPSAGIGVSTASPPSVGVDTAAPFTGQWSYVKSSSNPTSLGLGLPAGCTTGNQVYEVGARHWAAPPWEGRMVAFPNPEGTLFDVQTSNEYIQKVLLGTRPYGATPIDGMMEDARDYLWYNDYGPLGTQTGYGDPYVKASCRDQYVLLLTDGAPNMDMKPSCLGAGPPAGVCPYPNNASQVADQMYNALGNQKVSTFVIGFSVNGAGNTTFTNDGFPSAYATPNNNCKAWYNGVGATPIAMRNACIAAKAAGQAPSGSTADACCELNEVAYYGSGGTVGPFFAETQADLVLSFGRVLGNVSKAATTRTLPGYAPAVSIAGSAQTADFIASFIPNARKVWSGEIDRTRSVCVGAVPTAQTQTTTDGDSYATDTAAQAVAGKRLFITVKGALGGSYIDSARSIRPWVSATSGYTDNLTEISGAELSGLDMALASTTNWPEVLDVDDNTCKRSKAALPGSPTVTVPVPKLGKSDCSDVIWGFATSHYSGNGSLSKGSPAYDFNVRCRSAGGLAAGVCSISGGSCSVGGTACPTPGEVCVPDCAALGAIYRSSPTLVGPPNAFLRDDGYRGFADARKGRRPAMFVATSDGVLHAFKALANSTFDSNTAEFEMWAFIPPAVLPKLASNYPTGQQILLDGTPSVRDVVWERKASDSTFSNASQWHTTLVAGMGAGGAGYYALNVSDLDCGGVGNTNACLGSTSYAPATTFAQASGTAAGPHFLWQLTDIESTGTGEAGSPVRKARDGTDYVALFGKQTSQPAIATVQADLGTGLAQIGVAILPGGIDGPPIRGGDCLRAMDGGASSTYNPTTFDFSDATYTRRSRVRQWATNCATSPVPGRGVTIVRLDTGEVIRHFGRKTQDVPTRLQAITEDTPFDSPMIGTPILYPDIIGADAQKVFIADADGAIWRIDISSSDPTKWKAGLFQDLINTTVKGSAAVAADSQPVQVPPVLTIDPSGALVLNAATGDQETITASSDKNYVYSIREDRPTVAGTPGLAHVNWYLTLADSERVTGPVTVFDRTLYFATFKPVIPAAGACTNGGSPTLWGMEYIVPDPAGAGKGGAPRWCPIGQVDAVTGACKVALTPSEDPTTTYTSLVGAIIPGVTIRATQSCATFGSLPDDPLGIQAMGSTTYQLYFGATGRRSSGGSGLGTPQAERQPILRPLPRTTATIDAWSYVVD